MLFDRLFRYVSKRFFSQYSIQLLQPAKRTNKITHMRQSKRNVLFKMNNEVPHRVVGYFVVFPAIPDETIENNTFLASIASNKDWPTLSTSSPKEFYEGTVRHIMEYGATVMEHMEHLGSLKEGDESFEVVVDPLLVEEYEINYAFNTLLLKMFTDWPACSDKDFNEDLYHVKMMCARDQMEKLTCPEFQAALKRLYENRTELDEWQLKLIEWYQLEIRASGFDKHDEKSRKLIGSWSKFIDEYRTKYLRNIMLTNEQNVFNVSDRKMLPDTPPHILRLLATDPDDYEKGPWRARMAPKSIMPFLEYCADRKLRADAWENWTSRASFQHDFYNNSLNIEELRHNNEGLAKVLGFSSISEHRLANKMAGSVDTVRNFLTALCKRMRPVFMDRMDSWSKYAAAKEFITGDLQPFDLFYICRREAESHYDIDALELMNYFPFWETLTNLTDILGHIFSLDFKDITSENLERCHRDVRIFSVTDISNGHHLGRIYIDPFTRPNKRGGWTTLLGRPANRARGLDKLVYFIGAASPPTHESPSLLHHKQLQQLLFHIGRALQLLLSESPYREITIPWAPMYASDWDAADILPAFTQFFIYKPNLLSSLASKHLKTGVSLDEESANSISMAFSRSMLWESYRVLFWSDFDLTMYEMEDRRTKFWLDLYREMYKEYFPFTMSRNDYHPCSFTPIFSMQPYMGMYYRKLWTEMLALDVHETFDVENNVKVTGERFKTTVLVKGASDVQSELYRRFQGRDPSVGAICDFYDPPSYYSFEEQMRNEE
ncbi:hypothetical protein AB6A40_000490 [Gnathostoma spinigerum]|uniref:Peptidase M3A/M3B catalytic domain-containing protein n=1 Tax=Gnathostoma spinigerum TaxID=75299 RepID=A0ABD6E8U9_9BILA